MGKYCRECETERPNEAFSGKGRKQHICKRCVRHRGYRGEIRSWLKDAELSQGQMKRLRKFTHMSNELTIELATLVHSVGEVAPQRVNRIEVIKQDRPELLPKLESAGLLEIIKEIEAHDGT